MVKMLIIGGTSFIGSFMTKQLIKLGYSVDMIVETKESVSFVGYNKILVCDRSKEDNLKELLIDTRYDYIVDIDNHIKKDVMNLLNISSEKNIGKYILCSSNEMCNDFITYIAK